MSFSLFPEKAVSFSPSLAATLGLEEAVMLQGLQDIELHSGQGNENEQLTWLYVDKARLSRLFTFWDDTDIDRISQSLVTKGVLLLKSAPYANCKHLYFAFNDGCGEAACKKPAKTTTTPVNPLASKAPAIIETVTANTGLIAVDAEPGKQKIQPNWQPDANTIIQLKQHGISHDFVAEQLPEFVSYWLQRGDTAYAWGSKFLKHVLHEWRHHEARTNAGSPIQRQWQPSEDAIEILTRVDINPQFIEDALPEFVLYWRERGDGTSTWNSKFITHVKRQWNRYNATLEYDSEPHRIPSNWKPSADVTDIFRLANIDLDFARTQLPEFVLYWRDTGQLHASWNTKFLQHVKYRWARQHQFDCQDDDAKKQRSTQQGGTGSNAGTSGAAKSTFEQLTDRSWASGL